MNRETTKPDPDGEGDAPATEAASELQVQTQAFLDALSLRTRGEFDTSLAESMQNVLSQAIQIVESSRSAEADKVTPSGTISFPVYTEKAFSPIFERRGRDIDVDLYPHAFEYMTEPLVLQYGQGGLTGAGDLRNSDSAEVPTKELSPIRVFLAGGIPIATTVTGAMLLVASAARTPVVPNPYLALFVLLAGIGLIVTAVAALRERRQDQ